MKPRKVTVTMTLLTDASMKTLKQPQAWEFNGLHNRLVCEQIHIANTKREEIT